jgi:hypothetical protein
VQHRVDLDYPSRPKRNSVKAAHDVDLSKSSPSRIADQTVR